MTTALRLLAAERALTDAQHAAQVEREQLPAPRGAAAGIAAARARAGLPPEPRPDVTLSRATSAAVKAAETTVAALRTELRADAEARWTHDLAAGRAEAQRRVAARTAAQAPVDADGPAAPWNGAADGIAEARRRIAARGGAR